MVIQVGPLQQELEPPPPEGSTPYCQQPQLPMSIPSTRPPPYPDIYIYICICD